MAESKLGRDGHRQRMREQYLSGGMDYAPDHNLIELCLSTVIPRRDVKPLAYDLFNKFGSLEGILNATPYELMSVKGVGESTAIALSLVKKLNDRVIKNRNRGFKKLADSDAVREYCVNELSNETVEKLIQINLKNDGTIIRKYDISYGNVNSAPIDTFKITQNAMNDSAAYIILAHNHPDGVVEPSGDDIDITIRLYDILRTMHLKLAEHVVVAGSKSEIIIHNPSYEKFFNKKVIK